MTHIPLIDMQRYYRGDAAERADLAREVDAACLDTGFFKVAGHKVPDALVQELLAAAHGVFALPIEREMAVTAPTGTMLRGYLPLHTHRLARSRGVGTPPDLCAIFSLARPALEPGRSVVDPEATQPVIWPEEPADFSTVYSGYYYLIDGLAADLMKLFAVALGLPETYFADKIDDSFASLNTFGYPAQSDATKEGQLRAGTHSDFGGLTILLRQPDAGGLEVMGKDGAWHFLPPQPGRFVINIGDLMAQCTNHRWCSTPHRVVNPSVNVMTKQSRLSVGFFCHPNFEAMAECIPTCRDEGGGSKYAPVKAGTYMRRQIMAVCTPSAARA